VLRVILARAGLFIVFASAIWALLPLVARTTLHLGSGGYGLLLGSVGVGAVAGAGLLPRVRTRFSPDVMLAAGSIGMAAVTLVLAYAHLIVAAAVALVIGGACWVLVLSTLSSLYQLSLPRWIKARGMSYYLAVPADPARATAARRRLARAAAGPGPDARRTGAGQRRVLGPARS
jgi:hypothetical protein